MAGLEALGMADPFPAWEVWGVTVDPPREVRVGLTPAVAAAVAKAAMDSGVARVQIDPTQVAERTRRFIYEGYLA